MKKQKGFTLIELLVVIAIIGLLSTLAVVSLNSARLKSRDARRISDVKQVQTALEMWFNDQQTYPATASIAFGGTASIATGGVTYMAKVPADPTNTGNYTYSYTSASPFTTYQLVYTLEGTVNGITGRATATPAGLNN